ncbi:MAG TPA: DUF4863 family protein [Candidatus Lustribacter sp.]|jgi:hypothetical protein|nr:DUF4863 family protein [Candidatus Lustribacter sp.]
MTNTAASFVDVVAPLLTWLRDRPITTNLAADLERAFPPDGPAFAAIERACNDGLAAGWLGTRGEPNLRWGRIVKPSPASNDFSIDVVSMENVAGPHHAHPNGEIDMVIPLDATATFDGHGRGWVVYAPGSAHQPTVSNGRAIVLYALPAGAIAFT